MQLYAYNIFIVKQQKIKNEVMSLAGMSETEAERHV